MKSFLAALFALVILAASADAKAECPCKPVYAPVCGMDGNTYINACCAFYAGAFMAFSGPCPTPKPKCVCYSLYAPVCGVNGQTYSNDCWAYCDGIEIAYRGVCGVRPRE